MWITEPLSNAGFERIYKALVHVDVSLIYEMSVSSRNRIASSQL